MSINRLSAPVITPATVPVAASRDAPQSSTLQNWKSGNSDFSGKTSSLLFLSGLGVAAGLTEDSIRNLAMNLSRELA